jgi:hypothetical protein
VKLLFVTLTLFTSGCSLVIPESSGAPVGASARAGQYVATLISTLEPRIPELHRNPENDRYRLSLLLHSIDGRTIRSVPIASGLRANEYMHAARMTGDDGRLLWFHAHEPMAYDHHAGRLIRQAELPKSGEPRRPFAFTIPPPKDFLAPAESLGNGRKRPAILRSAANAAPLSLANPVSRLLTYRSNKAIYGTMVLARIDADGKPLWTTDTNLQDIIQILPAPDATVIIGKQPPTHPDEVRPPMLVIVDNVSGALSSHSLWAGR